MREQLNSNPIVKLAVIGVLLLGGGLFLMSTMGGGSGAETEEPAATSATALTTAPPAAEGAAAPPAESTALPPAGALTGAAPKLPKSVLAAWEADRTVVLLFVRDGGIDDRLVHQTVDSLSAFSRAATFVVPAAKISSYTAVTQGVGVERVPALVVVTPKRLDDSVPTASVHYGFQSPAAVAQAVIDAGYRGPTVDYHP